MSVQDSGGRSDGKGGTKAEMCGSGETGSGISPLETFGLPAAKLVEMLGTMLLIRHFDTKADILYQHREMKGGTHMYIGEEAVATGAMAAALPTDHITSTHRGHGHCLAKGSDPKLMMAELLGRRDGYCKGKGGSLHIADLDVGNLGANGIVGGGIPIATGSALSQKLRGTGRVTLCFFGDGATNTGAFHEALNLGGVWHLPVVYICENNLYGMSVPYKEASAVPTVAERASSYGFPAVRVDGNDVLQVYGAVKEAVDRARSGGGPTLVECLTYRWKGHAASDPGTYRTKEEVADWKSKCPILRFRSRLTQAGIVTEAQADDLDKRAEQAIEEALEYARQSPYPDPAEVTLDVYSPAYAVPAEAAERAKAPPESRRRVFFWQALNEALAEEMERDESVFLLGEDIALYGGAFGVTRDLLGRFGPERVRNTPISEAAIAGAAVGAAMTGMRPVAEIMYIDFSTIAMDQIVNQAAKARYMFGGKARVPAVFRTQGGGGKSNGAQHSQSLEAWYMHVPGLKVVMPSCHADAKGLLKTAIRDDNPVMFIEHKLLYRTEGGIPDGEYMIPFGVADIKRPGKDVTIVATSLMVGKALKAAEELAGQGIDAEVIDPRTLVPLDLDTILQSVAKTGRLVIAHEACKTCGVGAEIGMLVYENGFDYLEAPIKRVAALDVVLPCTPVLENAALPDEGAIVRAALETVR